MPVLTKFIERVAGRSGTGTITIRGDGGDGAVAWYGDGASVAARLRARSSYVGLPSLIEREGGRSSYLHSLYVSPERRGAGVGRELLLAAADAVAMEGARKLYLLAVPDDMRVADLVKWYERQGLHRVREAESGMWPVMAMDLNPSSAADASGTQLDLFSRRANPAPSADLCARVWYHGTSHESWAIEILRNGLLPNDVTLVKKQPRRGAMTPVQGRVYLTSSVAFAQIYAIGANVAGHRVVGWEKEHSKPDRRYGYLFEVDGGALCDIEPDEDVVGYAVYLAHEALRLGKNLDDYAQWSDWPGVPLKLASDRALAARILSLGERWMTGVQFRKAIAGEYGGWSAGGKRMIPKLDEETRLLLASAGGNVAHAGGLMPKAAWKIDKLLVPELKRDGSNFFDIAKRVAMGRPRKGVRSNPPPGLRRGDAVVWRQGAVRMAFVVLDPAKMSGAAVEATGGAVDASWTEAGGSPSSAHGAVIGARETPPEEWADLVHAGRRLLARRGADAVRSSRSRSKREEHRMKLPDGRPVVYVGPAASRAPGGIDGLHSIVVDAVQRAESAWGWRADGLIVSFRRGGSRVASAVGPGSGRREIVISEDALRDHSTAEVRGVVIHELAHHYREERWPRPRAPRGHDGHDARFREALRAADPRAARAPDAECAWFLAGDEESDARENPPRRPATVTTAQPTSADIAEAVESAEEAFGEDSLGRACWLTRRRVSKAVMMPIDDVGSYDDVGAWLDMEPRELVGLSDHELMRRLTEFRGEEWAARAMSWRARDGSWSLPTIVIVRGNDFATLGDGRGRYNLAVGLGLTHVPVAFVFVARDRKEER